ncbi:MAG: PilN domain-containing protein [Nitrospiria bacterium]
MIKINLLGAQRTKKKKKKVTVESQLIWFGLFAVVLALGWYGGWRVFDQRVTYLKSVKADRTQELTTLKAQVKAVENFEANKKIVKDKIQVIQKLRKNQSVPVFLLNEISQRLPERVWLVSLTQRAGAVELTGKATTNSDIVDFTNNLKNTSSFENVQILESRQAKDGNVSIYSFRLQWDVVI